MSFDFLVGVKDFFIGLSIRFGRRRRRGDVGPSSALVLDEVF